MYFLFPVNSYLFSLFKLEHPTSLKFIASCFSLNHLNSVFHLSKLEFIFNGALIFFMYFFLSAYTMTFKLKDHFLFILYPLKVSFTSHWFLSLSGG
jgi:hypothetical protein